MDLAQTILGVENSILGNHWQPRISDHRKILHISQRLEVSEFLASILVSRGIEVDDAELFFNPVLRKILPDPSIIRDMDTAATHISDSIQKFKKIAVFGDYDVDGATSGAIIIRFLNSLGQKAVHYVPDRLREGYGPNPSAFLNLFEQGVELIITVDCGISAFHALEKADKLGLPVIVVDHHIAEPRLPKATAIVNPNRLDDESGLGNLAAVGVTFLLLVAVNRLLRKNGYYSSARPEPDLMGLLDLVALGTVCDVVPLVGLNRAFVRQGLKVMSARGNAGLVSLSDIAKIHEPPNAYHAGYVLGPRVNAGGRVGESSLGVELLSNLDKSVTDRIAMRLDELNKERQMIENEVLECANKQIEERGNVYRPLIFVADYGWHPGVIGIVAGRLKQRLGAPSVVIAIEEGIGRASCRSIPGVDIGSAITAARQTGLIENGGGHAMAAGFTVDEGKIEELAIFLMKRLTPEIELTKMSSSLKIDGVISVEGATEELVDQINSAGPFGSGNAEPRIAINGAHIVRADTVGGGHVSCTLAGESGKRLKAIAFRVGGEELGYLLLSKFGDRIHLAGYVRMNYWQGKRELQFIIEDAVRSHS